MTKTETQDKLERAIRYCWNHTDNRDEERMVAWMAEVIGEDFDLSIRHASYDDGSVYFDVVREKARRR